MLYNVFLRDDCRTASRIIPSQVLVDAQFHFHEQENQESTDAHNQHVVSMVRAGVGPLALVLTECHGNEGP